MTTFFRSGRTTFPASFEDLDQEHGFVFYQHTVVSRFRDPALLDLTDSVRDRATVFVNGRRVATLTRAEMETSPIGGGLKQGECCDEQQLEERQVALANVKWLIY